MSNCLNCGKEVPQTEGKRERKYCDNKGACKQQYWIKTHPKKPKKKTIELPDDYVNWESVGILKEDGTIEELKDISQLPDNFKNAMRALGNLKLDTTIPTTITYHDKEKSVAVENKKNPLPEKLKGESALDYRIRCEELNKKTNP